MTATPTYSLEYDIELVMGQADGVALPALLVGNGRGGLVILDMHSLDSIIEGLRAARPVLEQAIAASAAAEIVTGLA